MTEGRFGGLSVPLFRTLMVIAALGTVLAAAYLLWLYQRTAFGTPSEEFADQDVPDVTIPEWIAWAPMLALIVAIGFFPNLVFRVTDDSAGKVAGAVAAAEEAGD
jgi:NADH-quinone oxidoreductase subunit M